MSRLKMTKKPSNPVKKQQREVPLNPVKTVKDKVKRAMKPK